MRPRFLLFSVLALLLAASPVMAAVKKPVPRPAPVVGPPAPESVSDDATHPAAPDLDEGAALPPYPKGARAVMGSMREWTTGEEDTLLDVARHFGLGYVEMRAANPEIDAWAPPPDEKMIIPTFRILPRSVQEGIVVNLAEMRLYYFKTPGAEPDTYPIGIGRDGLMTPLGGTTVTRKAAYPTWFPTPRMRAEHPYLPAAVPPGAMNPLGTHALYLGWPEFRIHGSNKPWAIGRRVSSGCMRMYPEDIVRLYDSVPEGTKVTVVEQPILLAWAGGKLWFEANPSRAQSNRLEIDGEFEPKPLTEGLRKAIAAAAGEKGKGRIDWDAVEAAVRERSGVPVQIAELGAAKAAEKKAEKKKKKNFPELKAAVERPRYNR